MATLTITDGTAKVDSNQYDRFDLPAGTHTVNIVEGGKLVVSDSSYALGGFNPYYPDYKINSGHTYNVNVNGKVKVEQDGDAFQGHAVELYNYASKSVNKVNVGMNGSIEGGDTGVYASANTSVINNGEISGTFNGLQFDGFVDRQNNVTRADGPLDGNGDPIGDGKADSNIKASTILTVTNNAGASIISDDRAISNHSLANMKVTNAGLLQGGKDEAGIFFSEAINSRSSLNLINTATGVVNGQVSSDWHGTKIDNKGVINGTIETWINMQSVFTERSATGEPIVVGTFAVPGGTLTLKSDGTFSGSIEDRETFPGFPDEVEIANFSGTINANNFNITGTYSGTDTFNVNNGGVVTSVTEQTSGTFEGRPNFNGTFSGSSIGTGSGLDFSVIPIEQGEPLQQALFSLQSNITGIYDSNRNGNGDDLFDAADKHINSLNTPVATITNSNLIDGRADYGFDSKGTPEPEDDTFFRVSMALSNGIEIVTNTATGTINGRVWMNAGHDKFTNSGVLNGDLETGWGDTQDGFVTYEDNDIIDNKGTINGRVWMGIGADKLTNAAGKSITGNVDVGTGNYADANQKGEDADTVVNKGTIGGQVWTGLGDDNVNNSGSVQFIETTAGEQGQDPASKFDNDNDTVTNSGTITGRTFEGNTRPDALQTGHGKDVVTNTATGVITGNIGMGTGSIAYANEKGEDDDTLTNKGMINGTVWMGLGDDTVTNSGSVKQIDTSAWEEGNDPANKFDNDNDTIVNKGTIVGFNFNPDDPNSQVDAVWMGHGKDSLTNTKDVTGNVNLGVAWFSGKDQHAVNWSAFEADDIDTVVNKGKITGHVNTGIGKDSVDNKGIITNWISTSDRDDNDVPAPEHTYTIDDDKVVNSGTIGRFNEDGTAVRDDKSGIWTGQGNDKITNSGVVVESINADTGNDRIENKSKGVVNEIFAGDGDDVVINAGTVNNIISLGSGGDKFTGGAKAEKVQEEDGIDSYTFNGGDDTLEYRSILDIDKADGGAGVDTLDLRPIDELGAIVVLDLAAIVELGLLVDADIPRGGGGLAFYDPFLDEISDIDITSNFENVIGTINDDIIGGSKGANNIQGNGGDDIIVGLGGKDTLEGGAGADNFYFVLTSDSGVALATADVITDYNQAEDIIGLEFMAGFGTPATTFLGQGAAFTTTAGQIRYSFVGTQTLVEVNTDGDIGTEFALVLNGNFSLVSSNFSFDFPI